MVHRARFLALALSSACAVSVVSSGVAHADAPAPAPAAPGLAMQAARATASDALKSIVQKLPAATREKLPGVYVAFAPDPKAALALAACDDDGDYVVVLSDAMLTLVDAVARAKATDDALSTTKLEAYARLLAKAQRPGERLLTPPAGFYDTAQSTAELGRAQVKQFRAIVTFLVATEVSHMTAGDLVCGRPTATHERGDDEWTAQEHEAALAVSREVHEVRRVATADARGAALASDTGESDAGYVALLVPLLAAVEATANGRASMPYVEMHKNQAVRAEIVQTMTARAKTASAGAGVRPATPAR